MMNLEMYIVMSIQTLFETNLSLSIENIIILLTAGGCLVTSAKDFRVALMIGVLLYMCLFIVFYEMNMEYINAVVAFLITIVLICVSLLLPQGYYSYGNVV